MGSGLLLINVRKWFCCVYYENSENIDTTFAARRWTAAKVLIFDFTVFDAIN